MILRFCIALFCLLLVFSTSSAQVTVDSIQNPNGDTVVVKRKRHPRDSTDKFVFLWGKEPRKNMVQWNFLSTFVLTANFSYERILSKHIGLLVGGYVVGNYTFTSANDSLSYDTKVFGASGYLELKAYPWGGMGRGPYIAPYSSFRFFKLRSPVVTGYVDGKATEGLRRAEVFNLGMGGVIGYRFILGNWFIINLYAGAGYNIPRFHYFDDAQKQNFNTRLLFLENYEVRFGMNLGIAIK
jgi:hypothetical protein